jgi:DNA-directed RNA polymerase specialized sigma subunit
VLNLALIKGLDSDEIIEELKLSRSNVNHAHFRGINKLWKYIGNKGYGLHD